MIDVFSENSPLSYADLCLLAIYNKCFYDNSIEGFKHFLFNKIGLMKIMDNDILSNAYYYANNVIISNESFEKLSYLKLLLDSKEFDKSVADSKIANFNFNDESKFNSILFAYYIDMYNQFISNTSIISLSASLRISLLDDVKFVRDDFKAFVSKIKAINKYYFDEQICCYVKSNKIIEVLNFINANDFVDMLRLDNITLFCISQLDFDNFVLDIGKLASIDMILPNVSFFKEYILKIEENSYKNLNKKEIFEKRSSFDGVERTLDEVGKEYGITRERVRQICQSVEERILGLSRGIDDKIDKVLDILKIKNDYMFFDEILLYIKDEHLTRFLGTTLFLRSKYNNVKYCCSISKEIIYKNGKLEELIEDRMVFLPVAIGKDELNSINKFDRMIIIDNYNFKQDKFYLKKGLNVSDLYCKAVDDLFPQGININEINLSKINLYLRDNYGLDSISAHALAATLERYNYCQIDKGTVINRSNAVEIPLELKYKILDFINNEDANVLYYSTIFEAFKDELVNAGINNRYYLKGLLDLDIHDLGYFTKRDYISLSEDFVSSNDEINDYIDNLGKKFEFDDLRKKFPGVKDYVFWNQLYKRNDILFNQNNTFLKYNYYCFNNDLKDFLLQFINDSFSILKTDVVTSSKIYGRLKMLEPEFLDKISFVDNQFVLYSLIAMLFKDSFYMKRPYISKNRDVDLNYTSIINRHVDSLDYFTPKIISDFCSKMHLRCLDSYSDFLIEKADKFLYVDMETCVRIEKVHINRNQIEDIKYNIDFFLNSFGEINTQRNNNFDYMPYFGYKWSKYLLVGVIRSYLNEHYDIEYTDVMYNHTDFIIRRKKK